MGKIVKFVFFSALGIVIFYFFVKNAGAFSFKELFAAFDLRYSLLGFIFYVLLSAAKAGRFNFFLQNKIGFKKFLKISFIHNFWNQVLPFSSGEISYVYLVRKSGVSSLSLNIASLASARVFDFFIIFFFFFGALNFIPKNGNFGFELNGLFIYAAFLIFIIFFAAIFLNKQIISFFEYIFRKKSVSRSGFVFTKIKEALESLEVIKNPLNFFIFLSFSLIVWLFDIFLTWTMSLSAGIHLTFLEAIIASAVLVFAIFILPFQTPLNIGTYEGALILAFTFFGASASLAFSAAFLAHIQNLIFAFILFLFSSFIKNSESRV